VTEPEWPTPASLGEEIAGADDCRQTSEPPLPRGWAGLVEKDRRARADSHPNAAGGFLTILYPWRLYIAVGGAAIILVLLLIDLLR
jgi:hypothetical protein